MNFISFITPFAWILLRQILINVYLVLLPCWWLTTGLVSLAHFSHIWWFISDSLKTTSNLECFSWLPFKRHFALLFEQSHHFSFFLKKISEYKMNFAYLRKKRHRLQFLFPIFAHENCFLLLFILIDSISMLLCILNSFFHSTWMKSISNIEHVIMAALSAFWILIWEVIFHTVKPDKNWIKCLHR